MLINIMVFEKLFLSHGIHSVPLHSVDQAEGRHVSLPSNYDKYNTLQRNKSWKISHFGKRREIHYMVISALRIAFAVLKFEMKQFSSLGCMQSRGYAHVCSSVHVVTTQ